MKFIFRQPQGMNFLIILGLNTSTLPGNSGSVIREIAFRDQQPYDFNRRKLR